MRIAYSSYYVFHIRTDRRGNRSERYIGRVDGSSVLNACENARSKFQLSADSELRCEIRAADVNTSILNALQTLRDSAIANNVANARQVCSNGIIWNR